MKIHEFARTSDIAGLAAELEAGVGIELMDSIESFTPLMWAAASPTASTETMRFLIENGANVDAISGDCPCPLLRIAINTANQEKVEVLLNAGANINYVAEGGYSALVDALYLRHITTEPAFLDLLEALIVQGARTTIALDGGKSALKFASRQGQFDLIDLLLQNGADTAELEWTHLMFAVALGNFRETQDILGSGVDIIAREYWGRTVWHLSIQRGDLSICQLLLTHGADPNERGQLGRSPLTYAIQNSHLDVLQWLLRLGVDLNTQDEFLQTPLMYAVEENSVEGTKILLEAGADLGLKDHIEKSAFQDVYSLEILRLFLDAGEDLADANDESRRLLLGLRENVELDASAEEYERGKTHRFGQANPEHMDIEFWNAMVRSGYSSDSVCVHYSDFNFDDGPVWTYQRFGRSITALPDGRYIEIAGENEDWYDPNFCIYNDVFVHYGNGRFEIFGYPKEVFPPTDFHSATLVGQWIYIVGCTGYVDQRVPGETPVYRLNIDTYVIEKVETAGENPGWISRHRARWDGQNLYISGGEVCHRIGDKHEFADNEQIFVLGLGTLVWNRVKEDSTSENE